MLSTPLDLTPALAGLGVGATVVVHADRDDGALVARDLRRVELLVGQASAVDADAVRIAATRVILGAGAAPSGLNVGDRQGVDGVRTADGVIATRVTPRDPGPVVLRGLLAAGALEGAPVDLGCCAPPPTPIFAEISGRMVDGALIADDASFGFDLLFAEETRELVVEGALAPDPEGEGARLSGLGLRVDLSRLADPPAFGQRAIFRGLHERGALMVERVAPASF